MNRFVMILAVVILPAWVLPAPADGIFGIFGKKAKVNPAQRVPELISILKTDQDERKRSSAATELGTLDSTAYGDIVPALVDAVQNDPKAGVRMEAASSLGSIRPVSALAGQALEKSVSSDDNWRVRWHAKSILMKYRMAGYSSGSKQEPVAAKGARATEPPLLDTAPRPQPVVPQPVVVAAPPPAQFPTAAKPLTTTSASKPAPKKDDTPEFRASIPRPLPQGPTFSTAMPQTPFRAAPATAPMVEGDGPPLTPLPSEASRTQPAPLRPVAPLPTAPSPVPSPTVPLPTPPVPTAATPPPPPF